MEANKVLRNSAKLVEQKLSQSLEKIFGIKGKVTAQKYNKSEEYDFQSPYALMHFKNIEKNFTEKQFQNKEELTDFIKEQLQQNYQDTFKKVDCFQNLILLQLNDDFLREEINTILKHGIVLEKLKEKEKVVVDFSSPNIAKEMHVGHLRSTIMGESICRVLEFLGDDVERVNHLGDWGTQFGMLILYLQEAFPDYKQNMPDVSDLTKFYKSSRARFDAEPDFKKRAQEKVVQLQSGDQDCLDAWKILCEVSMQYFNVIYQRLDITLNEYGESFYNPIIPKVLKELEEKKLTKLDQGAVCMFVKKRKQPLMLVKSDGGYNYDSTDMAAAWFRLNEWKANRVIYLTDIGQSLHFQTLFDAVQMTGWAQKTTKMEHMCFGIVCGQDGKRLKTRDGETVKLSMLLDEAKETAKNQISQRLNEEGKSQLTQDEIDAVAETLGIACIKYYDMRQNRIQDYKFDMEQMTSQKGDTAVYLMYSYIRICSILRKSGISEEELKNSDFEFTDEYEKVLAKHIVQFVDMINYVQENLALNFICNYLYNLAKKVASGYKKYQIIGNENTLQRIKLIYVIKIVMEKCFYLLGIKTIDKI